MLGVRHSRGINRPEKPSFATDLHPKREQDLHAQGLHYVAPRGTIVVRMDGRNKIEVVALNESSRVLKSREFDCRERRIVDSK